MEIIYQTGCDKMDWQQLFYLYGQVGLLRRLTEKKEFGKIRKAFERSYKVITAWEGETLVGAGRMLSDGICYAYINDLGVLSEYRGKGIGKELLMKLLEGEDSKPVHLTSTFGNEEFYKKCGFKKHKTAFAKYPFSSDYLED
jgi:aralkylamine N-acetyltransferase